MVAGIGQVRAGSLAYLLPVLGRSASGRQHRTDDRSGLDPLGAANLAGSAMLVGSALAALVLAALWTLDFGRRIAAVRR